MDDFYISITVTGSKYKLIKSIFSVCVVLAY